MHHRVRARLVWHAGPNGTTSLQIADDPERRLVTCAGTAADQARIAALLASP